MLILHECSVVWVLFVNASFAICISVSVVIGTLSNLIFRGFDLILFRTTRTTLELFLRFQHLPLTFFQKYAMQQAFKTMMGGMNSQSNQFNSAAFSPGSPFPFPMPSPPGPTAPANSFGTQSRAPSTPSASQSTITVDIPPTKVEAAPATNIKEEVEVKNEPKKIGNLQFLLRSPISFLLDETYL